MTKKTAAVVMAFAVGIVSIASQARAEWPARVAAPYIYGQPGALIEAYNATGQKYFTLAFTTASGNRRRKAAASGPASMPATMPANSGNPSFSGHPMSDHYLADDIAFIRSKGGDVIMSFGGAAGTELGMTDPDPAKIQAKYQAVIDEYKLTWIDMDIEGKAISKPEANHARNTALAGLQKQNPRLIVVYTLAADPNGIERRSLDTLRDAKAQGVKVEAVNLMTMDYGKELSDGKKMSDLAIATVTSSYKQMQAIDPAMKVGITPDIGINDVKSEIYGLDDARAVMDWAQTQPYVRLMAFWVSQRDRETGSLKGDTASGVTQKDWDFTNITKPFTTGFTPPAAADSGRP